MYIYVADLGHRVKIHRGSRFEKLLWRITDLRDFSKERWDLIHAARGYTHPDRDTVHHVFFTCPENAAKVFGWNYPADSVVYDFYKQRDALLHTHLPSDQLSVPWWDTPKFRLDGVSSIKPRGVEAWEVCNMLRCNKRTGDYEILRTRGSTQESSDDFLEN